MLRVGLLSASSRSSSSARSDSGPWLTSVDLALAPRPTQPLVSSGIKPCPMKDNLNDSDGTRVVYRGGKVYLSIKTLTRWRF